MLLRASCEIAVQVASDCPIVAMLRPRNGAAQQLLSSHFSVRPAVPVASYVDSYGNLCQRLVVPQGRMTLSAEAVMKVEDDIAVAPQAPATPVEQLPDAVLLYLLQSRYCPSDKMTEWAQAIIGDTVHGYDRAERIRAWIHQNLLYQYGVSSATTDALDSLGHGAGVCRDFAHVGIALCRSLTIPARIVVGYLHELNPMDMHAWFEAFIDGRWYTFDATQDKARGGRMVLAYGRDAADVAFISDYGAYPLEVQDLQVKVSRIG